MRTKFSPLHLYKSSFQRQVTTLTYKIFLLAYIKATVKAFWWGALLKFPHLIATKMAFWLGAFSKIQSMFTNIPLTYAKTVPKDPKRKGLKVTIAPLTNKLA